MSGKTISARRRVSLLASSSLVAASLFAGAGGLTVALAPGQALAADECGNPSGNGAAADFLNCVGVYATGINYPGTTNGDIHLRLVDGVATTTGGINIDANAGDRVFVNITSTAPGAGDPSIINAGIFNLGRALDIDAVDTNIVVNFNDPDGGDAPITLSGLRGVQLSTGGTGQVLYSQTNGGITATSGIGLEALTTTGLIDISLGNGSTVTASGAGVVADSDSGDVDVLANGAIVSGSVGVLATSSGQVDVTARDITAATLEGVRAQSTGGNDVNVTAVAFGAVAGETGISAVANGAGLVTVMLEHDSTVSGTTGPGIFVQGASGLVTVDSSLGAVTSTSGMGIDAHSTAGSVQITAGDVTASDVGVNVVAHMNATVNVVGDVTSTANDGVSAVSNTSGIVTVTSDAGTEIDGSAFGYGVFAQSSGGAVIITLGGDVVDGGVRGQTTGLGTVTIVTDGDVTEDIFEAVNGQVENGLLSITTNGLVTAGGTGIVASSFGTGDIVVNVNGGIGGGPVGVNAFAVGSGDITVNVNSDMAADAVGVFSTSFNGSSTVNLGVSVNIDPNDYGINNGAAVDATVNTLAGASITIIDDDSDGVATGIYNESVAAADAGSASSEVHLGGLNTVRVDADGVGGDADGGIGVHALNTGGGTGSVEITIANGADILVWGDLTAAVVGQATTGAGDVTITVGTGNFISLGGDDTPLFGVLPGNAGLLGMSDGGAVTITSSGNVQAGSVGLGTVEAGGIGAITTGLGTVTITTNLGSGTYGGDFGIITSADNGATVITTNDLVTGAAQDGITAESTGGAITITNNAAVQGGTFGISGETDTGLVTLNVNGAVTANTGVGLDAFANLAGGAVDINIGNFAVQGLGGRGVDAGTIDGLVSITNNGTVTGSTDGIVAASTTGNIDIDSTLFVQGFGGAGILASTGGDIDIDVSGTVIGSTNGVAGVGSSASSVVSISSAAGSTVTGTAGAGIAAAALGGGSVDIVADGSVSGAVGVFGATTTGALNIDVLGTVSGTSAFGAAATSTDGAIDIDLLGGSVSGATDGIFANATGTGTIDITGSAPVEGTGADGINANTNSGTLIVNVTGDVTGGVDGIDATSTSGSITVGAVNVTGGTGDGIDANTGGAGNVLVFTSGGGAVSGVIGIDADAAGTGFATVNTAGFLGGLVTGTGGDAVQVTTTSGQATVLLGAGATSTGGDGIDVSTSAGGAISVNSAGAIDASDGWGITATATAGGNVTIVSTSNIGTALDPTALGGILGYIAGGASGVVDIDASGDIFTDGTDPSFDVGIGGVNNAAAGGVTVDYNGGTVTSAGNGVGGGIINAANASNVVVTIGAGSTIHGDGGFGVFAGSDGTGNATATLGAGVTITAGDQGVGVETASGDATATLGANADITALYGVDVDAGADALVTVGDNSNITATIEGIRVVAVDDGTVNLGAGVTIDPNDYGVDINVGGDATFLAGNNLTVDVNNTDADDVSIGVFVQSTQAADVGAGDPTIDIDIGTGLTITVDNAGGEADGSAGVYGVALGAGATVDIDIGNGVNIDIVGNSSVGVAGQSVGGAVTIDVGTGTIDVLVGNATDSSIGPNFPGSWGVAGRSSAGGAVTITNNATLNVTNAPLGAIGLLGFSAGGSGDVILVSNGGITSSGSGIAGFSLGGSGLVNIDSNASIAATLGTGIVAGTTDGPITIDQAAATTISAGVDGINASSVTGNIGVTLNGTITAAGDDGIQTSTGVGGTSTVTVLGSITATDDGVNAATSAGLNTVNFNSGTITVSGDGIDATTSGGGGITVTALAGTVISGDAANGILANATGATNNDVTIITAANIGTALNHVSTWGAFGQISGSGSGNVVVNNSGIVFADGVGVYARTVGTGNTTAISSGAVTGNFYGIISQALGGGNATVTNTAAVTTTNDAIFAQSTTGSVLVTNSAALTSTGNRGIAATSTTGPITVNNNAGGVIIASDDGINATASGAAAVTVTTAATVTSNGADGIQAGSAGGTLIVTNSAVVSGAANGVLTGNTLTGTTTVNANANISGSSAAGFAGINTATTGTGLTTVAVASGITINGNNGSAIRTSSNGGAVNIGLGTNALAVSVGAGASSWVVDMTNAGAGLSTLTVATGAVVRSSDNTAGGYDDLAIRGVGGSVVINNAGRIQGRVRFQDLTGNVVFNNTSSFSWHTTGASTFSPGNDLLNNTSTGVIFTNAGGVATSWDFLGGATDTFTNAGILVVGEPTLAASTLTISNLEIWNNSGRIVFGSSGTSASDGAIDDRILSSGTTFTGSGSSLLAMDANLGAVVQTSCGALTAADCFSLTGGSAAGSSRILVNDISPNVYGAYNPTGIVLVDVSGAGSTSASVFGLDPASDFWRADLNSPDGVLDKGLFFYDLTLNLNKQHLLVGLPDSEAFEFTVLGTAAQNAWYTTTGTWHDRQADLRDQLGDITDSGTGVWVKIAGGAADRDLINSYDLFGVTYSFDTSYEQTTISLQAGVDFISATTENQQWVVGGMIGYVDSDVDFNASNTMASMEGMTLGVYGTYVANGVFVDGIIAGNFLDLNHQAPTLAPAGGNIFPSEVTSWGGQVEGGFTMPIGANGFFEPVALLSYVKTEIDDITVPGAVIDWDEQTSLRGSLGARLGMNADFDTFIAKFVLTGRAWNEFEGENGLVIHNAGPDLPLGDDFGGSFGEVSGSVNLFSSSSAFSAFANAGVKFKDDYQSTDASLGFRWRW